MLVLSMATTSTLTLTKELDSVGRRKLARLRKHEMDAQTIIKQATVYDLETMDDVTLRKVGTFAPVATAQEALSRLGNDTAKFLKVVNDGLRSEALRNLATDESIAWQEVDDDGELKPFNGAPADAKVVNPLILTLAKTVHGYNKDMSADAKRAAKEAAKQLIKSTPAMVAGLKKSAAAATSEE